MPSYKPVIYVFSALGVLALLGAGVAGIQAFRHLSSLGSYEAITYQTDRNDPYMNSTDTRDELGSMNFTDDETTSSDAMRDDSYLGLSVPYVSMQDKSVMMDLKLPDTLNVSLRSTLQQPDTHLEEIYRSETRQAFKMTSANGARQTFLVQNLDTGEVYDTGLNANANFLVAGPNIVILTPNAAQADELIGGLVHNIDLNTTRALRVLSPEFSYTETIDTQGPVANMRVVGNQVEVQVYSTKEPARSDVVRTPVRTERYPTGS